MDSKCYCGGIDVMPDGWPLQRMRSMRKEEVETRSKGQNLAVRRERRKQTNVIVDDSR